jgi:hypothetical protein
MCVAGLGRSGTTWISKVIDSSPEVLYFHEPDLVKRIPCIPLTTAAEDFEAWGGLVRKYVEHLPDYSCARSLMKRPYFNKHFHQGAAQKLAHQLFLARLRFDQVTSKLVGVKTLRRMPIALRSVPVIVWKTVTQTGNIGCFLRAFPEQQMVHVIRHPCGFIDSVLRGERTKMLASSVGLSDDPGIFDFALKTAFAQKLGLTLRAWRTMDRIERLAYIWLCWNEQANVDADGMVNYHLVYFDEMCQDSFRVSKALYDFLGLVWGSQTEAFIATSTTTNSSSYYSVNRVSQDVPTAWKSGLSADQIKRVLEICSQGERMTSLLSLQQCERKI